MRPHKSRGNGTMAIGNEFLVKIRNEAENESIRNGIVTTPAQRQLGRGIPDDILISHRRLAANAIPFCSPLLPNLYPRRPSLYFLFKVPRAAALSFPIRVCILPQRFCPSPPFCLLFASFPRLVTECFLRESCRAQPVAVPGPPSRSFLLS